MLHICTKYHFFPNNSFDIPSMSEVSPSLPGIPGVKECIIKLSDLSLLMDIEIVSIFHSYK